MTASACRRSRLIDTASYMYTIHARRAPQAGRGRSLAVRTRATPTRIALRLPAQSAVPRSRLFLISDVYFANSRESFSLNTLLRSLMYETSSSS